MKLLIISTYGSYPELNNGPPIVIYELLKKWSKKIDKIYLISGVRNLESVSDAYKDIKNLVFIPLERSWGDWSKNECNNTNLYEVRFVLNILLNMPRISWTIIKAIKSINPDIIFYNGIPFDPALMVPILIKLKNIYQIARVPVYLPFEFKGKSDNKIMLFATGTIYNFILKNIDLIITQSNEMSDYIKSNLKTDNCIVIPNGVNLSNRMREDDNRSRFILLYVGNINSNKGIQVLLDSLIHIRKEFLYQIEVQLVGYGDPEFIESLREKIKVHQLKIPINFLGIIAHDKIMSYYNKSDIYVFPSYQEGMSLSLLEAMGAGLPIIASNINSINCLIKSEFNGLLFEVGNASELASCIERLLEDKMLRERIGLNAYKTSKDFSWESIADRYLAEFGNTIRFKDNYSVT